jgi:hypothetical protein
MNTPRCRVLCLAVVFAVCLALQPCLHAKSDQVEILDPQVWRQTLASNWLAEEYVALVASSLVKVTPEEDAAGGCDGIINGEWGFHTDEAVDPWWQVDLGKVQSVSRVVVWNRCQAPERAASLMLKFSADAKQWQTVYEHNGKVFHGFTDQKPLEIKLAGAPARYVRIQLPQSNFLHLEEVEVYGPGDPPRNLALHQPATQISISKWSRTHSTPRTPDWAVVTERVLAYCQKRAAEMEEQKQYVARIQADLSALRQELARLKAERVTADHYLRARFIQRRLVLANPLLDFDTILFNKRVPGSFNHMSDQYYGWFSKPGGGLYLLRHFKSESPSVTCLTDSFTQPGSFLRPTLSYDARKVMFAWCRYYPKLAKETNKLDKANVPEDAFYHLFEMNLDGSGLRRLTHGKYDDFDGRYLPDGRIVFLSTRRGQSLQAGRATAACTVTKPDQPDIYVRCGGGPERPVAVYTLHTMDASGGDLTAISPFEMFEWTPEINHDGAIMYSRWDYIDRDNMPYMGLWASNPDGTNPRVIFGNFTKAPHCVFEPKPIPNSRKIIFTASAHHAQTMGSLVLLDPSVGTEGPAPMTRLTPEVPMPEIESWPKTYYASPWPLSERFYLTAWGYEGASVPGPQGWDRWHAVQRPDNGMSLYLFDAAGCRELIYRDTKVTSVEPIPVKPRLRPPAVASHVDWDKTKEGRLLLADVYRGLKTVPRGEIKALRLIAVPPKTHPTMDYPHLGITKDDPGKCVLGTVPVEADGSAFFRLPAGVIVFFQALDAQGVALQTMRSVAHVQPGQTLSCAGCHEHRNTAPQPQRTLAILREPSRITPGPEGSWPFRFDRLVQPVLDRNCVNCHHSKAENQQAAKFDLGPEKAYTTLIRYGKPNLQDQVKAGYARGFSIERDGIADRSALKALLLKPQGHYQITLSSADWELVTWMDAYAQRSGSFSAEQERHLEELRTAWADLLESKSVKTAALDQ